jgi:hypothetical protein
MFYYFATDMCLRLCVNKICVRIQFNLFGRLAFVVFDGLNVYVRVCNTLFHLNDCVYMCTPLF